MTGLDRNGPRLDKSRSARWGVLLAIFGPAFVPVYLVGSGRIEGAAPMASLVVIVWTIWALVVIGWSQRARSLGWGDIGLRRPQSWPRAFLQGLGIAFMALVVAGSVQRLLVQPLVGAEADVSRFDGVRGDLGTLVVTILSVWITSAIPEEIIWRGFLMTRLSELLGGSRSAWFAALLVSAVLFGALHVYQGVAGIVGTGTVGLVFGFAYLWLRNVWPLIIAHALMHVVSFTALYLGVG